jgi:hypothetical protein
LNRKAKIRRRPHAAQASTWRADQVRQFIASCCEHDPAARERATVLYRAYLAWATAARKPVFLTVAAFGLALRSLGYFSVKADSNFWLGLRCGAVADTLVADGSKSLP